MNDGTVGSDFYRKKIDLYGDVYEAAEKLRAKLLELYVMESDAPGADREELRELNKLVGFTREITETACGMSDALHPMVDWEEEVAHVAVTPDGKVTTKYAPLDMTQD